MSLYKVKYKWLVEFEIESLVEANSEEEAKVKAREGDSMDETSFHDSPWNGIEIKNLVATPISEEEAKAKFGITQGCDHSNHGNGD